MARRRGGGRKKQGVVSWITSAIALLIGLIHVWVRLPMFMGGQGRQALDDLDKLYNPLRGDAASLRAGYGSLVGGIAFKVLSSELTKRAKLRSIIPALRG